MENSNIPTAPSLVAVPTSEAEKALSTEQQQKFWAWAAETRKFLKSRSHNELTRMCLKLLIDNHNLTQGQPK